MLQIKIVQGHTTDILNSAVNDFLANLKADDVRDIRFEMSDIPMVAIIQYEVVEEWRDCLCCDCQYWDDQGDSSTTSGLCHECGQRRRFNNKACKCFKDIRG